MGEEFSFPTQMIDQTASETLTAVTELEKIRHELFEAVGKAAGNWEGTDADTYLSAVKNTLDTSGEAPGQMFSNIGNRLKASLGNYTVAERVADSTMQSVKNAFK